jgi:transcriptional regulator
MTKGDAILQGTLDLLVLKTLDACGPLHGYGIARQLEEVSRDAVSLNPGTIYASVVRLQQRRWISATWSTSDHNRRARFFAITTTGRKQLSAETEQWNRVSELIERVLSQPAAGREDVKDVKKS